MRWRQYADDPIKVRALANILLGAATADAPLDLDELIVVEAVLLKALGASRLSPSIEDHLRGFRPSDLDLVEAVRELGLGDNLERYALLRIAAEVTRSDQCVVRAERLFVMRLGACLGIPPSEVVHLIGRPERPVTGPRPRPRPAA